MSRATEPKQAETAPSAQDVLLPQLVSAVILEAAAPLRARMLECLLRPLRPLSLAAIAAGAFGAYLHRERWDRLTVTIDDAVRVTALQVLELASFVGQAQPEAFQQLSGLLADQPPVVSSLSGAALLIALRPRQAAAPPPVGAPRTACGIAVGWP